MLIEVAKNREYALEYEFNLEKAVATFNIADGLAWSGQNRRFEDTRQLFFYRNFKSASGWQCMGASSKWDPPSDDPRSRPGKVLFGYICLDQPNEISANQSRRLMSTLAGQANLHRFNAVTGLGTVSHTEKNEDALQVVRGEPSRKTGNTGFPFMVARYYTTTGGGGSYN